MPTRIVFHKLHNKGLTLPHELRTRTKLESLRPEFSAKLLERRVRACCCKLIDAGVEETLSISVCLHGVEVLSLTAERAQTHSHARVEPAPLYMAYSITKGLVGATALALLDKGLLKLQQPVKEVWPSFAPASSWYLNELYWILHTVGLVAGLFSIFYWPEQHAVDPALSLGDFVGGGLAPSLVRLAGLVFAACVYLAVPLPQSRVFADNKKHQLTCGDALAHRGHLQDFHTLRLFVRQILCSSRCCIGRERGHRAAWRDGRRHIEALHPSATPGSSAFYHFVNYSWLAGGVVEACAGGDDLEEVVRRYVTDPLHIAEEDAILGPLPDAHTATRLQFLCSPSSPNAPSLRYCSTDGEGVGFWLRLAGWVEGIVFCTIGNSRWFRDLLLPSSNGVFTASAVARVYGALAAGGALQDRGMLVSPAAVQTLRDQLHRSNSVDHHKKWASRNAVGFCPWHDEGYGGEEHCVVGHSGMGGSVGFADLDEGLGLCILKSSYTPTALRGTTMSPGVAELICCVRSSLGPMASPIPSTRSR
eukprot:INCI12929.1.p1 GENE.INCI12929.1~~INCI12929.1.p1  ORF type:complete len:533 (-),score=82.31 INCI12929.1:47-1645(-)